MTKLFNLRYYSEICLSSEENHDGNNKYGPSQGRDLNPGPPKHEAECCLLDRDVVSGYV